MQEREFPNIARAEEFSKQRLAQIRNDFTEQLNGTNVCLVTTGSFARRDASANSDLDYLLLNHGALTNSDCDDIHLIRYHKTIAVDFEFKTSEDDKSWGIRNIKLLFSRNLLYFSGILVAAESIDKSQARFASIRSISRLDGRPAVPRDRESGDDRSGNTRKNLPRRKKGRTAIFRCSLFAVAPAIPGRAPDSPNTRSLNA